MIVFESCVFMFQEYLLALLDVFIQPTERLIKAFAKLSGPVSSCCPFIFPCVYNLSIVHLSIHCPSIYPLSICLSIVHLSIHCPSVYPLSIYLSIVHLSIHCPSIYPLSIYPSIVYLSIIFLSFSISHKHMFSWISLQFL